MRRGRADWLRGEFESRGGVATEEELVDLLMSTYDFDDVLLDARANAAQTVRSILCGYRSGGLPYALKDEGEYYLVGDRATSKVPRRVAETRMRRLALNVDRSVKKGEDFRSWCAAMGYLGESARPSRRRRSS